LIFFWLPVAAGALIGKLSGGQLRRLTSLRLRHLPLLLVAVAAQVVFTYAPPSEPDPLRLLLPLTTALIGLFVALNLRLPGMRLVLLGVAANLAVISANGGLMPTSDETLARAGLTQAIEIARQHPGQRLPTSKSVVLDAAQTRLAWLSDVFLSPPPLKRKVVSPGDLAIALGLAYLTLRIMRSAPKTTNSFKEQARGATDNFPLWDSIPPWARPPTGRGTWPERAVA
jgi:hypothetical protein